MNTPQVFDSHTAVRENVEYILRDKDGNLKQMFTENALGTAFLKFIRRHVSQPIDEAGQVKPGLLNYLAAYGLRIPFLTGSWGYSRNLCNLITSAGRAVLSGLINGSGAFAAFTYIAVGTGTTAAAIGDTALQTETATSGLSRAAGSVSRITTSVTNDTAQVSVTFTVTGTVAVTESGLLNAASVGTLLAHQVYSAQNVANGDTYQVIWKIQNA
jgi:hypothetical protein